MHAKPKTLASYVFNNPHFAVSPPNGLTSKTHTKRVHLVFPGGPHRRVGTVVKVSVATTKSHYQ